MIYVLSAILKYSSRSPVLFSFATTVIVNLTALICRLLIQDGTGEAHLYLRDRVIPVALGVTDTEWSDLLDLVHKVGQLSYTKSSFFKV